ncbi:hypothetical protein [Streptomyces sp. LUP30]|uniref:hypothetical protein n=1 Tax=Streptomyces sp. LUP30 TaxID=1890285 RepID=UPI00114D22DC|nr:hypothetical protein [Streptomyces sp. LUP30]
MPFTQQVEDAYWAFAVFDDLGHAHWTGPTASNQSPKVVAGEKPETAYRVAFRLHHGRQPDGPVHPACGIPRCVAGAHLMDAPLRHANPDTRIRRPSTRRRNASRADVVALLAEGHSNKEIGRRLHTDPHYVGRIRVELGFPAWSRIALPIGECWAALVRPVHGGHARWAGPLRDGMPNLVHGQRNHSARRVGFALAHGREPIGRVLPTCGAAWCVAGEHAADAQIRRADHLYSRIFSGVAA